MKKSKIQTTLFMIITMVLFSFIGLVIGKGLTEYEKIIGNDLSFLELILYLILSVIIMYLFYFINTYAHELGHVLFGLLTGYEFSSIRFGSILIYKSEGKLKIGKYHMAGTGGQALMIPPKTDPFHMPYVLYNAGGLIINLLITILGGIIYLNTSNFYIRYIFILLSLTALAVFVTNGLPFTELGTDGANIILLKDKYARLSFYNSLIINHNLYNNIPIKDMDPNLFYYDKSIELKNPLVTALAVNKFSYLFVSHQFDEAYELGNYIKENAKSINKLHAIEIELDTLYMLIVIQKEYEKAKKEFDKNHKEYDGMKSMLPYNRTYYA
ncbi:MAG: hypothetical protein HUJ53_08195, partial [Holdemanella sp.]|nr:hypothetical protein [Holdemanella sp.]